MIERKFVTEKIKEFQIQETISASLKNAGISKINMKKTPLGEKIIIYTSRPGLVVGKKGESIKKLTKQIKKKFNLENPQIEIDEVENVNLNAKTVAEKIVTSLEMFGSTKFKGIGHKVMSDVMNAGALGIEIVISGKIPSSRAKSWRFYSGYIKKCGDFALTSVDVAYGSAKLKTGIVGVKVKIMPPTVKLPDKIEFLAEKEPIPAKEVTVKEEATKELPNKENNKESKKNAKPKRKPKKTVKEEKINDEDKGNKGNE
jgi:small subunit ribosomal protein S3